MCQIFPAKLEHDLFFVCIIQNHVSFCKTEKCCKKFLNTILGYSISFRQINDTSIEIHKNKSFFTVWYKNVSMELVLSCAFFLPLLFFCLCLCLSLSVSLSLSLSLYLSLSFVISLLFSFSLLFSLFTFSFHVFLFHLQVHRR